MPTRTIENFPPREQLEAVRADLAVAVPGTVANGHVVHAGDVLGMTTATGLLRRRTRTLAAGNGFTGTSNTGQVSDATLFRAGDVLKDASGATIGTVQGVDAATNTITLTANAQVAVPAGNAVLGSDGSQVAVGIAGNSTDGQGDTTINLLIGGYLRADRVRGLDAQAQAELGGVTIMGIFKF